MELFERVKVTFQLLEKGGHSLTDEIGVNIHTFKGYLSKKRQDNLWPLLGKILEKHPEVSRDWLYFGEGRMLRDEETPPGTASSPALGSIAPFPVPIVGLAACGVEGIEQIMPYAVTASPIILGPRSVAVMASGESMVPAGIASGHMCFCDPDQVALPGEAVFFKRKDDKGALKLFLGMGTRKGFTAFKGWLPVRDAKGHQKEFCLDVADSEIDYIAPVVFIRRRL